MSYLPEKRQNLYDNNEFFNEYSKSREDQRSVNRTLEQPVIRALLPTTKGSRILDLGCGAGEFSRWLLDEGAISVLGIDPSSNMLETANKHSRPEIAYQQSFVEDLELPVGQFDLVVSSLMFHYIEDLKPVIGKVRRWLNDGGALVFSIEHPMTTAIQGKHPGWLKKEDGERVAWMVDDYRVESERVSTWIVDDVVKYHRTMSTVLNILIESGFRIDRVSEGYDAAEIESEDPEHLKQQMRPRILFVRAIAD